MRPLKLFMIVMLIALTCHTGVFGDKHLIANDDASITPLSFTDVNGWRWYDAVEIGVRGKGWTDTETPFDRLPRRANGVVRKPVWSLSQDSAGLYVDFVTDADAIRAQWTLRSKDLAMKHMPATGVSGLDLYVKHEGRWRWLATGQPSDVTNDVQLVAGISKAKRQYRLYLPLYNGVREVKIGVPGNSKFNRSADVSEKKPIVFWGTSITQGACASRPGMCHTSILGRNLSYPVINLGFSGNGRMEPEVATFISEIDAAVYVIDCLPNLNADQVRERTIPVVNILRSKHPVTPILLVEDRSYADAFLVESKRKRNETSRAALQEAFKQLQQQGVGHLYYLPGENLLGRDGEDTVDSSHPTDLGFFRQAHVFQQTLQPIVDRLP